MAMGKKASTKSEVVQQPNHLRLSSSQILLVWLARMSEHYRQPISTISGEVYREMLSDLTAAEMEAACREAMRTSEFMPTVATIRNALRSLQSYEQTSTTAIRYDDVKPEDRIPDQRAYDEMMTAVRAKIFGDQEASPAANVKPARVAYTPRTKPRSIEESKSELRKRGYLK